MMKLTKDSALEELQVLVNEMENLKQKQAMSAEHIRWLVQALDFLEAIFGKRDLLLSLKNLSWGKVGSFVVGGPEDIEGAFNPQAAIDREHHKAYLRQLDFAKGILYAAQDRIKKYDNLDELNQARDTTESSSIIKIINLVDNKLRKLIRIKPIREKEIQEAFENLLIGADIAYSREAKNIEYSSKTYIPDFTIDMLNLAIEIKICTKEERQKSIISEINDDILAYKTYYSNLLFVIYDTGFIRDVDIFRKSFEDNLNVIVRVIKH